MNGICRQCGKPRPPGYSVTCGASRCQEQEAQDNAVRARVKRVRSVRKVGTS